jgi:hypothetical protein
MLRRLFLPVSVAVLESMPGGCTNVRSGMSGCMGRNPAGRIIFEAASIRSSLIHRPRIRRGEIG